MGNITSVEQDTFIAMMDFDSAANNFTVSFKEITKKCGKAYINFCIGAWEANETMTEEEFMAINANMPRSFLENVIKP